MPKIDGHRYVGTGMPVDTAAWATRSVTDDLGGTMSENYIDLDPGAVSAAGQATAATSGQWSSWASRTETGLRQAAADAQEAVVTAAFEEHLTSWNPRMQALGTDADALGTNAVSASHTMLNADGSSAATLGQVGTAEQARGSALRRSIAL